jgi:hypothetical protein
VQEKGVARCRALIEDLERKRVKSALPNPLFVALNLLFKCTVMPFEAMAETIGNAFHALMSPQSSFTDEALLFILMIIVLIGISSQCAKRKRRQRREQRSITPPPEAVI